jgi:hypothetical protein
MVAFSDRMVVPAHVLVRYLDGESVLLNLETEIYLGLDVTGTGMWELATSASNIEVAYGKLTEEFEVEPELLRHNLVELPGQLVEYGLLKVAPTNVASFPEI